MAYSPNLVTILVTLMNKFVIMFCNAFFLNCWEIIILMRVISMSGRLLNNHAINNIARI